MIKTHADIFKYNFFPFSSLFNGCTYHGHIMGACTILPKSANQNTLNFQQQSFGSLALKLEQQIAYYQSENILVNSVWECEFLSKEGPLKESQKVASTRLIPRFGLRGLYKLFSI